MGLDQEHQRKIQAFFKSQREVAAIFLYGSQNQGTANPMSDLDLGILFKPEVNSSQFTRFQLEYIAGVERIIGDELSCDLKILNEQSSLPYLFQVFSGDKLMVNDQSMTISFMTQKLSQYYDFVPVINDYHNQVTNRLRQGKYAAN
ncbi:hypothetical protein A2W24_04425 [Microgenomates group bacterium RBG_16_45_19]|nr:MAG: hypothetical protein A2W24_04425 [Microgenomates group bacterium RBG_16_45_19]